MEYVTSRGFPLTESGEEFAASLWFNLWRTRLWPYRELVAGDVLYWYESPTKCITWKSRVMNVHRFAYADKGSVQSKLQRGFGGFNPDDPYFVGAPDQGYCLAWKATPLQKLSLPKPDDLRFPRQGWLRVDAAIAREWLCEPMPVDDTTLDGIASKGTLLERLHQLNAAMGEVCPKRVRSIVSRTVRRDTRLVRALKEAAGFRCQFPGCGATIRKEDGGFYIEVAHVKPVREGGQSALGNLVVLCPNHHKEFDYGALEIVEQTVECLCGRLNGDGFEIRLPEAGSIG